MPPIVYSVDEVLDIGLELSGWGGARKDRVCRETNIERFKDNFGVAPVVYAQLWEDLQTTTIKRARIKTSKSAVTIENFLHSIHFLKQYPTEKSRAGRAGRCEKYCRKWGWYFLKRVARLKKIKIKWPNTWATTFIISIDGVHCRFHETKHATLSKDPARFSHKFSGPGIGYELALALFSSDLVWLNGPNLPSVNDLAVYQDKLKNEIPDGKKAVVDGGYGDKKDAKLSHTSAHEPKELRKFKAGR